MASGYGCAMWCTVYGATGVQGGTVAAVRGERRADGERFCFTSRSWFGIRIAKISPKKLGDYNCLLTGI